MISDVYGHGGLAVELEDFSSDRLMMERRHSSRVKLVRPITLIESTRGRHLAATTRDISPTGMKLRLPSTDLRPGGDVQLDVTSLVGIGLLRSTRQVVRARIVWARRENKMVRPMMTVGVALTVDFEARMNVA